METPFRRRGGSEVVNDIGQVMTEYLEVIEHLEVTYCRALATTATCPLICVVCDWACRRSSSFSADCSWDFLLLDQRRMLYRFFFRWLEVQIIYQVRCLVLSRNALLTFSKDACLSLYNHWLRRAPLVCFIMMAVISVLASSVGYTEASKIQSPFDIFGRICCNIHCIFGSIFVRNILLSYQRFLLVEHWFFSCGLGWCS
jgi:hypothetical protein